MIEVSRGDPTGLPPTATQLGGN